MGVKEVVESMKNCFDTYKDMEEWIHPDGYIAVFYDNVYMPNIWEDVEKGLSKYGLWIETGNGDPYDLYVCGNIE